MKFEYEETKKDREPVAYIDEDGDLVIKQYAGNAVTLFTSGQVISDVAWYPSDFSHKKLFYPGDKITITF